MTILVWLTALLMGIGQNLPFDSLYPMGVSPADIALLAMSVLVLADAATRAEFMAEANRLRQLFMLAFALSTLTAVSCLSNAFTWDMQGNDLVEMLRPFYYFLLVVFVSVHTRRHGLGVLTAFLTGILVSGVVSYLRPTSEDVLGFVMLWNPNVIGNMLAVGILFASLLIFDGRLVRASVFMLICLVLSIFTYSKGTWLMALAGLLACLIAMRASSGTAGARLGRWILGLSLLGLVALVARNFDALYDLVAFKLFTTQLGDTAAEGGTAAARWGFVEVSFQLALEHPLLGIGISNFESVYRTLERPLGNAYWVTDNPHSAWLYILACMGIPALLVFFAIFVQTLRTLAVRVPLQGLARQIYIGLFFLVLFLSGAVMLQLLTQYFFWFFAGVVHGWQPRSAAAPATAPSRLGAGAVWTGRDVRTGAAA